MFPESEQREIMVRQQEKLAVELEYRSARELQAENEQNWLKASERTRKYLSW